MPRLNRQESESHSSELSSESFRVTLKKESNERLPRSPDWENSSDLTCSCPRELRARLEPLGLSQQYCIEGLKGVPLIEPIFCRERLVSRTADVVFPDWLGTLASFKVWEEVRLVIPLRHGTVNFTAQDVFIWNSCYLEYKSEFIRHNHEFIW